MSTTSKRKLHIKRYKAESGSQSVSVVLHAMITATPMSKNLIIIITILALILPLATAQGWGDEDDDACTTPNNEAGTCIPIKQCKYINDILDQAPKPIPPGIRDFLKRHQCGFIGRQPKVCCPNKTPTINLAEMEPQAPDVTNHRNFHLLPKDCGYLDTSDRIVNGNKTQLFEFPWMALLAYKTKKNNDFKCGGSIINSRYILTAAHCLFQNRYGLAKVRIGEYDYNTEKDCLVVDGEETCSPPYEDLQVEQTVLHPGFSWNGMSDDIALIRVARPIVFNEENIRPVCLPVGEARNYNFTGRNVVVTGWGRDDAYNTFSVSSVMLKAELPLVPLAECQAKYKEAVLKSGTLTIDHRQLCAGGRSKSDACSGDSGGPLHVAATLYGDTRYVQQGIVSLGPTNCGLSTVPGLYTNLKYFMPWILDTIRP